MIGWEGHTLPPIYFGRIGDCGVGGFKKQSEQKTCYLAIPWQVCSWGLRLLSQRHLTRAGPVPLPKCWGTCLARSAGDSSKAGRLRKRSPATYPMPLLHVGGHRGRCFPTASVGSSMTWGQDCLPPTCSSSESQAAHLPVGVADTGTNGA